MLHSDLIPEIGCDGDAFFSSRSACLCALSALVRFSARWTSHPYLGLEWHGQMQPGRLQSSCLVSYVAFSLQKDEIIGGQTPSGYPGKDLSVGSGDVSG
jgi:hypothetical protein